MIPLTQQDYFKYYQVLKGNFYKGASSVRAIMSNITTADELLESAAAVAVLFAHCKRSTVERLALNEVDHASKADKALVTQANSLLGTGYTTLVEAMSASATVNALLANEDANYAIFNLANLFSQIVAAAQTNASVVQNTVKFRDFYYAYKRIDWAMIYSNCTQSTFAAPTFNVITTAYNADTAALYLKVSARVTSGDFTVFANSTQSASTIQSATKYTTQNNFYLSDKYFMYPISIMSTTAVIGVVLYDRVNDKIYAGTLTLTSAGYTILMSDIKIILEEATMMVLFSTYVYWNDTSQGQYYYQQTVTKFDVSLKDAKMSNMANNQCQAAWGGISASQFFCFPLSNGNVYVAVAGIGNGYNTWARGYIRAYHFVAVYGSAALTMLTGFNGDANSVVTNRKLPYSNYDTINRIPTHSTEKGKCFIGITALTSYSADSQSETQITALTDAAEFMTHCAYVNSSNVATGERIVFTKPATTFADYLKYLGITDYYVATPCIWELYSNKTIGDVKHIIGDYFHVHAFTMNTISYSNTTNVKTGANRTYVHVMYMDGTTPVHQLFRVTNIDTSITYQPHIQTVSITGVRINSSATTVDTDFASTSDFVYTLKRNAAGTVTLNKEAAPANSIALPADAYTINLLAPKTVVTHYSTPSYMIEQNLFPNG